MRGSPPALVHLIKPISGEPGLAGFSQIRIMEVVVTTFKAPVISSPPTNQHPTFYRPDALPITQPTVSKH